MNLEHDASPLGSGGSTTLSVTDDAENRAVIEVFCRSATRAYGQNCSFPKI